MEPHTASWKPLNHRQSSVGAQRWPSRQGIDQSLQMGPRRSALSDVSEPGLSKVVERSPLIQPRKLRSCRSTPASRSVLRSAYTESWTTMSRASSMRGLHSNLMPISELEQSKRQPQPQLQPPKPRVLHRSRSMPQQLHSPYIPPSQHLRSPQYRVYPVVKFDHRPFPERMNYGIAGYNTSRPRSQTSITLESKPTGQSQPVLRCTLWRLWSKRFHEKMIRIRVKDCCSKLASRFRGKH